MKPLNIYECSLLEKQFSILKEAYLRDVLSSKTDIICLFRKNKKNFYLFFDLKASAPCIFLLDKAPDFLEKKTKPLRLFLKAHFLNKKVKDIILSKDQGRVFKFHFYQGQWEVRLFSKGANFIVSKEEKSISWNKVKELQLQKQTFYEKKGRSIEEMKEEWLQSRQKKNIKESKIEIKKERALLQIEKAIQNPVPWKKWALWLQSQDKKKDWSDLNVPPSFKKMAVLDKTLLWNMSHAFEKAKMEKEKTQRLLKRKKELEKGQKLLPPKLDFFQETKAKGRKKILSHSLAFYVGKSGKDNLALLRKAKPWHYWVHLRDYAGAHLIIQRNKGQKISDEDLSSACDFLVESTFKKEKKISEKIDFIITEVRFVRPIKGDALGRVHYQREKVMTKTIFFNKI